MSPYLTPIPTPEGLQQDIAVEAIAFLVVPLLTFLTPVVFFAAVVAFFAAAGFFAVVFFAVVVFFAAVVFLAVPLLPVFVFFVAIQLPSII
jgi:hypothetical protein